jgi:hypothetical protein
MKVYILLFVLLFSPSFLAAAYIAPSSVTGLRNGEFIDLLKVNPNQVSMLELQKTTKEFDENLVQSHLSNGIVFKAAWTSSDTTSPSMRGTGGDSAIFTGYNLAANTYRFMVEPSSGNMDKILESLGALYLLTHISGVPGVLARTAFPLSEAEKFYYPTAWAHRIKKGIVYTSSDKIPNILKPGTYYPKFVYYTKATKDQLTGVLFGLSVCLNELDYNKLPASFRSKSFSKKINKARKIIALITKDLFYKIEENKFKLRDHHGRTYTSANKIKGLIRTQLISLFKKTVDLGLNPLTVKENKRVQRLFKKTYRKAFIFGYLGDASSFFNIFNLYHQYYAWNLRLARSFSILINLPESEHKKKATIRKFIDRKIYKYIKTHKNSFFLYIYNASRKSVTEQDRLGEALYSLKSISKRPLRRFCSSECLKKSRKPNLLMSVLNRTTKYVVDPHLRYPTGYFLWQKDPYKISNDEQVVDPKGRSEGTGLGLILPYWMARFYKFI